VTDAPTEVAPNRAPPTLEWPVTLDDGAHFPVYVCGVCGKGHLTEDEVQVHADAYDPHLDDRHDGESYSVFRVFIGTTLRWRPDTDVGVRVEVAAFGHDGETPWVGLVSPTSTFKRAHMWWRTAQDFVEACFPEDLWESLPN
jgi:hypothetical protein